MAKKSRNQKKKNSTWSSYTTQQKIILISLIFLCLFILDLLTSEPKSEKQIVEEWIEENLFAMKSLRQNYLFDGIESLRGDLSTSGPYTSKLIDEYKGKYAGGCGYIWYFDEPWLSDDILIAHLKTTDWAQTRQPGDWNWATDYEVSFTKSEYNIQALRDDGIYYENYIPETERMCFFGRFKDYGRISSVVKIESAIIVSEDFINELHEFINHRNDFGVDRALGVTKNYNCNMLESYLELTNQEYGSKKHYENPSGYELVYEIIDSCSLDIFDVNHPSNLLIDRYRYSPYDFRP